MDEMCVWMGGIIGLILQHQRIIYLEGGVGSLVHVDHKLPNETSNLHLWL